MTAHRMQAGLALVLCSMLYRAEAIAKDKTRHWRPAVVVDVVSPERQHAGDADSPAPAATMHQRSPYPVFTAPGGNTRWVFVLESQRTTFVFSSESLAGNSPLRKLQPGDTVETARQGGRTVYVRTKVGKEEKLRLLPNAIVEQ